MINKSYQIFCLYKKLRNISYELVLFDVYLTPIYNKYNIMKYFLKK